MSSLSIIFGSINIYDLILPTIIINLNFFKMNDHYVITIGRQFGSGGRAIGKKLSSLLNIEYYDKELIKEA